MCLLYSGTGSLSPCRLLTDLSLHLFLCTEGQSGHEINVSGETPGWKRPSDPSRRSRVGWHPTVRQRMATAWDVGRWRCRACPPRYLCSSFPSSHRACENGGTLLVERAEPCRVRKLYWWDVRGEGAIIGQFYLNFYNLTESSAGF